MEVKIYMSRFCMVSLFILTIMLERSSKVNRKIKKI